LPPFCRRLLVLNTALLYRARDAIRSNKPTAFSSAMFFLHRKYKKHLFWWELVEMLRLFVLVGVMVLFQGTMMQLITGTLLAVAFLLFQVQASPYANMSDDLLASSLSFCVAAIFLCSYAFKEASLTGLGAIQDKMSIEQRSLYILNQGTLSAIVTCGVIAALVISGVIFVFQFAEEAARVRREALASKARRLRYVHNDKEVDVPNINAGEFHLFLSHVWGSGQDQMRVVKTRLLEMLPHARVFLGVPMVTV
jgi:hypothetical protein